MAFTLKQLRYFVAVAENGTVSGAAQALAAQAAQDLAQGARAA